jgi:uncharacterized protein YdeI (YjbR/CyaY-like superfamily)
MLYLKNLPVMHFQTCSEWDDWLAENHQNDSGIWVKIAKKGRAVKTPTYAELLDVALCYGWIDGQKYKLDDDFYLQKFTPRRKNSIWSKINTEKAEKLMAAGRMQPAGLAEIEQAKRDGRWAAAYHPQSTMPIPEELKAALDANPKAKAFFDTLNKTNRFAFCMRVQSARKPETRQKRVAEFIKMLENEIPFYPPKPKKGS